MPENSHGEVPRKVVEVNSIAEYKTDHPSSKYLPDSEGEIVGPKDSSKILSFPDGSQVKTNKSNTEATQAGSISWVRELLSRFHKQQKQPPEKETDK